MPNSKHAPNKGAAAVTPSLRLVASDGRLMSEVDAGDAPLTDYEAATELIEHLRLLRDGLSPTSMLRVDVITLLARLERFRLVT
jgi:hypothetical protein